MIAVIGDDAVRFCGILFFFLVNMVDHCLSRFLFWESNVSCVAKAEGERLLDT